MPNNRVRVLLFAIFKDLTGVRELHIDLDDEMNVLDLRMRLLEEFPRLKPAINTALVAVNKEYASDSDQIPMGAEVGIFPPVSGGNQANFPTILAITEQAIDLNSVLSQITLPSSGAAGIFTGVVRAKTARPEPRETSRLEYETYGPMAEAKLLQVAQEIRSRWPAIEGIAIVQRIGMLDPGTPTVMIACTAAHRDSGVFEAARYGIDRLKEIVPIWKKEVGPHGEVWVEGHYIPKPGE